MLNHDAFHRDFLAAEQAHREFVDRFNSATICESCEAPLGDERYEGEVSALCPTCARQFAAAFLPEILAAANGTRWA